MILTAHQPQYLPGLRLFDKIARADLFVFLDTVPMESSGFENRNKIRTANGWQWLTVPVKREGYQSKPVKDIEIAEGNWRKKHWASLVHNYGKAPYFSGDSGLLFYLPGYPKLADLCLDMLRYLLITLGITTPVFRASDYQFHGHKSDLVLDMCKQLGATKYIFGVHGKDYADVEAFRREGIDLEFQDYQHPVYPQQYPGFVPNMSVIDLLFNCGPRSRDVLLSTVPAGTH